MPSNRQLNLTVGSWSLDLQHPITDTYPTGGGMWLGPAPMLFGPPPTIIDERAKVATAGSTMTPLRHGPRDIVIPISVQVPDDPSDMEAVLADFTANIDALAAGLVRITYTRDDGTSARFIDAYHRSTAPVVITHDTIPTATVRVAFRAPDPYWTATESTYTETTFADQTSLFYGFSYASRDFSAANWTFSSDDTAFTTAMTVTGDMPARATFEVDGPADLVDIVHFQVDGADGDGRWWRYDAAIADGSTLTVDGPAVTVDVDGVSQWGNMQGPNRLMEFPVGDNTVWLRVPGDGANTEVRIKWQPRWLSC